MNVLDSAIRTVIAADFDSLQECLKRSYRSAPDTMGWTHETRYVFADGRIVSLTGRSVDDALFPAAPGCTMLYFERPSGGDPDSYDIAADVKRAPVLGWCLNEGDLSVITPDGIEGGAWWRSFSALALPDGSIFWRGPVGEDGEIGPFRSFALWIDRLRSVWRDQLTKERSAANPCSQCGHRHDPDEIPF